jgi:hypothetical protein
MWMRRAASGEIMCSGSTDSVPGSRGMPRMTGNYGVIGHSKLLKRSASCLSFESRTSPTVPVSLEKVEVSLSMIWRAAAATRRT